MNVSKPFFTIGVTTYNRHELLRQTLASIREQTFADFEVLVGNDWQAEKLSADQFDFRDARFRFINHPRNLGEVENMNSLLRESRGRYFTWMGDDDFYAPDFFEAVHATLEKFHLPACVFTAYSVTNELTLPALMKRFSGQCRLMSGREFLRKHLAGELMSIVTYGVFDAERLRRLGGIESLVDAPIGIFCETMLMIRAGFLKEVVYIEAPLIVYRAHPESWVRAAQDSSLFKEGGKNLIGRSLPLLSQPELRDDFQDNLSSVMKMALSYFLLKAAMPFRLSTPFQVVSFLHAMAGPVRSLRGTGLYFQAVASYWRSLVEVFYEGITFVGAVLRAKMRSTGG